jgi:hypothetical protein
MEFTNPRYWLALFLEYRKQIFGTALLLVGLRNLLNGGFVVAVLLAVSWFLIPDSRPYILQLKADALALLSFYFGI